MKGERVARENLVAQYIKLLPKFFHNNIIRYIACRCHVSDTEKLSLSIKELWPYNA